MFASGGEGTDGDGTVGRGSVGEGGNSFVVGCGSGNGGVTSSPGGIGG